MGGGAALLIIAFSARLRERLRSGWRWGALRLSLPIIAVAVVLVLFESTLRWWTGDPPRWSHNPAFMNPEDLEALGLEPGSVVRIASDHAAILGVVEAAPELRRGVVSMSHAFGDAPDRDGDFLKIGSSTARLVDAARDFDPYSGIPRMSAIPVASASRERSGALPSEAETTVLARAA